MNNQFIMGAVLGAAVAYVLLSSRNAAAAAAPPDPKPLPAANPGKDPILKRVGLIMPPVPKFAARRLVA